MPRSERRTRPPPHRGSSSCSGAVALFFIVVGSSRALFYSFGDILLMFFLAWLLAFIFCPSGRGSWRSIPRLPRAWPTVIVYPVVRRPPAPRRPGRRGPRDLDRRVHRHVPQHPRRTCRRSSQPWQDWLDGLGLTRSTSSPRPADPRRTSTTSPRAGRAAPAARLREHRRRSARADRLHPVALHGRRPRPIMAFLFRLVPPAYADEARLLQTSVSRSFGGFLRGQAIMGLVYGLDRARHEHRARACRSRP